MFTTVHGVAIASAVLVAITASASGAAASLSDQPTTARSGLTAAAQAQATNESLSELAKLLGSAFHDKVLRQQFRDEITKRGTADNAVTLDYLLTSSDLRRELAETYRGERSTSTAEAQLAVDRLTASLPPMQVSVPIKMGAWNAATAAPMVGYVPAGIDDKDLKTITAYDSAGRQHVLDAWVEPDQPVIILGPDETAFHDGTQFSTVPKPAARTSEQSTTALAACYNVRLTHVVLWDDHEPWAKGMAEIFLAAKAPGLWYKDEFPYLEMDGDQYWPDAFLGCAQNNVSFYWWEDDSAAYNFSLKLGDVDFGVQMSDEDDLIGGRMLQWSKFEGTSVDTTDFTGLVMKTH